jgi:hypothetical protein
VNEALRQALELQTIQIEHHYILGKTIASYSAKGRKKIRMLELWRAWSLQKHLPIQKEGQ